MATKFVLAVVLVAAMMCGALANDVPVKFCAKDCNGTALAGYKVQLSGCTDRAATCTTHEDGCCSIDRSPDMIQYCNGAASNLCQWSILSGYNNNLGSDRRHLLAVTVPTSTKLMNPVDPFIPDTATFVMGGNQVSPHEFSGCHCDGSDTCKPVIYNDESSTTPYTVTFTPKSCGWRQGFTDSSVVSQSVPRRKLK